MGWDVSLIFKGEGSGIISDSIATANAEKIPITPSGGQENISILQQATKRSGSASTQFTFTCDSQVPGTVPWPGPKSATMHQSPAARTMINHETQTGPDLQTGSNEELQRAQAKQGLAASQHTSQQKQPQAAPKKSRRRTGKEYLIAARTRREQQKWRNESHPIPKEQQWTCEFCEYEQIFGTPPVALIKQYEMKDRQARKQEAERRRLLEKAKMKGRKGKKGSKAAPKAAPVAHDRQVQPPALPPPMGQSQSYSQATQSEDYYEDEYEDEYAHEEHLPSSPTGAYDRRTHPTDIRKNSFHGGTNGTNNQVPVS